MKSEDTWWWTTWPWASPPWGKSGIVSPGAMDEKDRQQIITGFGRLLKRYKRIYIPGPDVGTNDADMKTFAIENGLNNAVSKPVDMGGNRIDELGGAANGVVAFNALVVHMPRLRGFPQFRDLTIPDRLDVLIQDFGAVGAHVARNFNAYSLNGSPLSGVSAMPPVILWIPKGFPGSSFLTCGRRTGRWPGLLSWPDAARGKRRFGFRAHFFQLWGQPAYGVCLLPDSGLPGLQLPGCE